jgi:branched-chain amino acid transport system permease protein
LERFIFLTTEGLATGAVYAAFSLALVLIWRAARLVNFSQGAIATAGAYIGFTVTNATGNYWLGFIVAMLGGLVVAVVVERGAMRFVGHERPLDAVIVALGVVLIIQAILGFIFYGVESFPTPIPFSQTTRTVGGFSLISDYDLFVVVSVLLLVTGLSLLFAKTRIGLRMRAAAFAPEVSRLLGVNVTRMITLGWALAGAVAAMAAVLVVPTELGLNPTAMDGVFIVAFTAAVIGGLDSPQGAVIGGLAIGLLLNYVTGYLNPQFEADLGPISVLVMLLAVLLIRPNGLFSGVAARQV